MTKAFRRRGHEAYSCDLLPCSGGHPEWHLQQDVLGLLGEQWDLLIAFPPCTHLATSGSRHFAKKRADGRQQAAVDFVKKLGGWPGPYAIENPVGVLSTQWRKPDQIIQPWMFGHKVTKATCLWTNKLPPLKPTNVVEKGEFVPLPGDKRMHRWHYELSLKPHKLRGLLRSKTFQGVAEAMAEQWGAYVASPTETDGM